MNTDAEGKISPYRCCVLYKINIQPSVIMDFATLTGAAIVALGDDKAAAFESNSKVTIKTYTNKFQSPDEMVIELPITATRTCKVINTQVISC